MVTSVPLGVIQMLCNAVGDFKKMYGSMLFALLTRGRVKFPVKKRFVTLEWPLIGLSWNNLITY